MTDIMCTNQSISNSIYRVQLWNLYNDAFPSSHFCTATILNISTSTSAPSKLIKNTGSQFPVNIPSEYHISMWSIMDYHKTMLVQLEFGWSLCNNQKVLCFVLARGIYNSIRSCHELHACRVDYDNHNAGTVRIWTVPLHQRIKKFFALF